jgi:UDPglucose 6-dehydrogenase
MKVSVIGCGKLGLSMVAFYASRNHEVHAIDKNEKVIEGLKKYRCHIVEPYVQELIEKNRDNITCGTDFEETKDSEISFVIVPTPTDKTGEFNNEAIFDCIGKILSPVIVIVSTVKLGSMRHFSKYTDSKVLYNPEFIALGSVIHDMGNPDSLLIGEEIEDSDEGNVLVDFFWKTYSTVPVIHRMTWENAEVAKLALNCAVTAKISLANTLAEICSKIPGGNVDVVTAFVGSDSRIGKKYLTGGTPFSGTCFPRDNRAFDKMADRVGVNSSIQRAVEKFNKNHVEFIAEKINMACVTYDTKKISILGTAYKPGTNVTAESPAKDLGLWFKDYKVATYDPLADCNCGSMEECLSNSDLVIILTQDKVFKSLPIRIMKTKVVFDCWRWLDKSCLTEDSKYYALGVNK